jgi:mannobiose 2-epimerase
MTAEDQTGQKLALAERMQRITRENVDYWVEHGPDRAYGGFYGFLDRRGRPGDAADKGLVQQSRHLWTFATLYQRLERSARIESIARDLYRFIIDRFSAEPGPGFVRKVDRAGHVVDPVEQVYPQAFAVYALSAYSRVFAEPAAAERALSCWRAFDRRVYDPVYGGYNLAGDPPWMSPGAAKETNTHIHVMEALTALGEVSRALDVHQRLREMTELTVTRHVQPNNYAHYEFLVDYTPFGEPRVSYGHDLETSWLVLDAMRVIEEQQVVAPLPPSVAERALDLGVAAAEAGFDADKGGYCFEGTPGATVLDPERIWWVQFEALACLVRLHLAKRLPDALERLRMTLDWIENRQYDRQYGEFYWGVLPDGTVGPYGDLKSELWKATYHSLRALMFAADWLSD